MTAAQIPAGVPRALDGLLPGTPQGRPQPPTGLHLGPVLAVTGKLEALLVFKKRKINLKKYRCCTDKI